MTSVEQAVNAFGRTPQGAGHSERTRDELRETLRSAALLDDLPGWSVTEIDDDEVVLVGQGRREVATWRRDHP